MRIDVVLPGLVSRQVVGVVAPTTSLGPPYTVRRLEMERRRRMYVESLFPTTRTTWEVYLGDIRRARLHTYVARTCVHAR